MLNKEMLQGQLLSEHRRTINEISEIKSESFELNEDQKLKIKNLELRLMKISEQLYTLYKD